MCCIPTVRIRRRVTNESDYEARSFQLSRTIGGMGIGNLTLHAAGVETLLAALTACMTHEALDARSVAQRRADALVTMAELALRSGSLPETGGVKPQVTVTATLGAMTDQPGSPAADFGYGSVTSAEWARRFACDAAVAAVVFGADGAVLHAGRSKRTFTPAQRRAIIARDRTCIWPGCDAPPAWCDAHHCTHWGHHGMTDVDNGALLCGRHHDRVHAHGHAVAPTSSGPYQVNLMRGSDPNWQGHRTPHHRT